MIMIANKFELKEEKELGQHLIIKIEPAEEIFSLKTKWDNADAYFELRLFLTDEERHQLINILGAT